MTFRTLLRAAAIAALVLLALAAAGFLAVRESARTSDHPAMRAAMLQAAPADLGRPVLKGSTAGFQVNYYSECVGLSILIHERVWTDHGEPGAAAVRADAILPDGTGTMCIRLKQALDEEMSVNWFTYARYWHGSLILHRLVLSAADYPALMAVATVVLALCGVALFAGLIWLLPWPAALAIAASAAFLTDARAIVGLPLQATCMAAFLLAAALFVAFGARRTGAAALVWAAGCGALLNFFDFLYNPSTFAMLCAWTWLAAGFMRGQARPAWQGLLVFLAALGGYGAFWSLKWAIAYAFWLDGEPMYIFQVGDFTRWGPAASEDYLPGRAILAVFGAAFDTWWKLAVAGLIAALALGTVWLRRLSIGTNILQRYLVLMSPVLPAFAVIEAMAGHTMAHTEFTFRIVPWTLGLALAGAIVAARQIAPEARNATISAEP
jgi:hypothetical protein